MTEEWLTIVEYARRFQISDMTVRRRIKTGRIQADLREGKYYIPVSQNVPHVNEATGGYETHPRATYAADGMARRAPEPATPTYSPQAEQIGGYAPSPATPRWQAPHNNINSPRLTVDRGHTTSPEQPSARAHAHPTKVTPTPRGPGPERDTTGIPSRPKTTDITAVSSSKLLKLCDDLLAQMKENERKLEESFCGKYGMLEEQVKRLTAELENRDLKLNRLSEQVEDLQLLIKILDDQDAAS
ncbi:MAG: hypothetical protein OXT67_04355 [Zetaproteobacteria bacterium]|nr:hypothetical protein [Zetaproteobacteria bacterium]